MDIDRIVKNTVVDDNGCWIWTKSTNSSGYGQLTKNKKYWTSHRYAFACNNGAIPDGLIVRHKCHNKKCCNPEHLELGTDKENYYDSMDVHINASKRLRKVWIVGEKEYNTFREAVEDTGISANSLSKFTDKNTRIFDIDRYRESCAIAGWIPKI